MKQSSKHLKAVLTVLAIGVCMSFGTARIAQAVSLCSTPELDTHVCTGANDCGPGQVCSPFVGACAHGGLPNGDCDIGEQCDDGNTINGDGCDNNCTFTCCGNGVQTTGEECDNGSSNDCKSTCNGGNACDTSCHTKSCGNGRVECDEQCDDGDTFNLDDCDSGPTCALGGKGKCLLPTCGNGITDSPREACDDGNTVNGDGCDTNCTASACGNGIKAPGEACDDGNTVNGDGCEGNCALPKCGDNITDNGETCDDGNTVACDGCSATCKTEGCGNGTKECGEACDDGNTTNADGCEGNCSLPKCGNSITDAGESCDDGDTSNSTSSCPGNCLIVCGDGITSAGEGCDTGECVCDVYPTKFSFGRDCGTKDGADDCALDGGVCVNACGADHICGNGNSTDDFPACDPTHASPPGTCGLCATTGNSDVLPDHCRDKCKAPSCGDGVTDSNEGCDDGLFGTTGPSSLDDADQCPNGPSAIALGLACNMANVCGDGFPLFKRPSPPYSCVGPLCALSDPNTELCDNGGGTITSSVGPIPAPKTCAGNPTKTCADDVDCVDPQGTTGPCGNGNEPGQCRANCVPPSCGDMITDPGEGCDDGNTVAANCDPAKSTCGGGTDTCGTASNACANPGCGDGITQTSGTNPEECDANGNNGKAGNNTNVGVGGGADCTTACKFNVCGDKSVQDAEQCDDGNTNPFDDCNACVTNVCGDGVTDVSGKNVEQCDDHNTAAEDGCFECCSEAGSITGNLPSEFAAKACLLNKLSAGVSGLQIKNRKTASTLVKTMSKTLQLEATAQGIDPNGNKGKNRNKICSLERRVRRLLINVQKGISKGVLSGNVGNALGSELVIKAEDASQWATQISSELLCTPR